MSSGQVSRISSSGYAERCGNPGNRISFSSLRQAAVKSRTRKGTPLRVSTISMGRQGGQQSFCFSTSTSLVWAYMLSYRQYTVPPRSDLPNPPAPVGHLQHPSVYLAVLLLLIHADSINTLRMLNADSPFSPAHRPASTPNSPPTQSSNGPSISSQPMLSVSVPKTPSHFCEWKISISRLLK